MKARIKVNTSKLNSKQQKALRTLKIKVDGGRAKKKK